MTKLDFFRWQDMYHLWRNKSKENKKKSMYQIYQGLILRFGESRDVSSMFTCAAEMEWFKMGCPYYKIWPSMAHALSNISIEIDSKYLCLPFPSYEICLPKNPIFQETPDSPGVCSILVHKEDYLGTMARGVGFEKIANDIHEIGLKDGRDWSLMIHYQLDADLDKDWRGWYFRMGMKDGIPISEQFKKFWEKSEHYNDGYEPSMEFCQKLLKLSIAVAFFGIHQHEMVMPDIPNRLIERYHNAIAKKDESEAKKLLEKAKKMGHFGWRCGSEIDLPQPLVKHITDEKTGQTRRELTFGHIRSGHLRLQPVGKRENPDYELRFIPPTTVRPDLPLRDMRGFRLRDNILKGATAGGTSP
jgi:hypothetical protein